VFAAKPVLGSLPAQAQQFADSPPIRGESRESLHDFLSPTTNRRARIARDLQSIRRSLLSLGYMRGLCTWSQSTLKPVRG
jgi:hypothetical protein